MVNNNSLEPFKLQRSTPYTKPITVQRFLIKEYQDKNKNLFKDLNEALEKDKNKSFDLSNSVFIKCRKFEEKNGKLFVFVSFYDDKLQVSTTQNNADDQINSVDIDNADSCHLFFVIKDNDILAFSTISALHLKTKLICALNRLLHKSFFITEVMNTDIVAMIKEEGVKQLGIEGYVDLLALGFKKENFLSKLLGQVKGYQEKESSPFGQIIFDKKNNPTIIESVEHSPALALEYISEDETDNNHHIFIVTKQNRKIEGIALKEIHKFFVIPYGKTKTVTFGTAISVLDSIQ